MMHKKKILNFITDEKFTDLIINTHDLFTEYEHEYFFVNSSGISKLKKVKQSERIQFIKVEELSSLYKRTDIAGIFLHSLYSYPVKLISKIPDGIKLFWFSWGYDIYERPLGNPLIKLPLYRNYTKRELKKLKYFPIKVRRYINRIIKKFLLNGIKERNTYFKAIKRIDFFSGILPIEYDMVKELTNFKAKKVEYKYLNLKLTDYTQKVDYTGNNILIGNSAHPTNNHIDILQKLTELKLSGRNLIVPLSYGGFPQYANSVNNFGSLHFGKNWKPMDTFMEIEKYQNTLSSCSVGIFLMERQQGMGNINMMLRRGCKVFLSETSVTYKYLQSIGVKVFSFESELTQENLDTPLSEKEKKKNRELTMKAGTFEATERRFREIYKLV